MSTRPPVAPFTIEGAVEKVRLAEDAWNTRDSEHVAPGMPATGIGRAECCWEPGPVCLPCLATPKGMTSGINEGRCLARTDRSISGRAVYSSVVGRPRSNLPAGHMSRSGVITAPRMRRRARLHESR
jgi:hypothetical protein